MSTPAEAAFPQPYVPIRADRWGRIWRREGCTDEVISEWVRLDPERNLPWFIALRLSERLDALDGATA